MILLLRISAALVFVVAVGVWAYVNSDMPVRYSDMKEDFDGDMDEPGFHVGTEPADTDTQWRLPAATGTDYGARRGSYLSPDPAIPSGERIPWATYWRDMSPEEMRVYGTSTKYRGPSRVGIQAGHSELSDVPDELAGLRTSSGARGGGHTEQETVLIIADEVKKLLEAEGIIVDLLPATVPVDYRADAFVSIHADGSTSADVSGYKISGPRRDFSGEAELLVEALYDSYGEATGLRRDANVTRRMQSYYAFNWRRYDHAIHPQTPGAIVETGFMTNTQDRAVIVSDPERPAHGIAEGILRFLAIVDE